VALQGGFTLGGGVGIPIRGGYFPRPLPPRPIVPPRNGIVPGPRFQLPQPPNPGRGGGFQLPALPKFGQILDWFWGLLNRRGYRDQQRPGPNPGQDYEQDGTGEYTKTGITRYTWGGTCERINPNTGVWENYTVRERYTDVAAANSEWNPANVLVTSWISDGDRSGWQQVFLMAANRATALAVIVDGRIRNPQITLNAQAFGGSDRFPMPGELPLPPTDPDPAWQPEPLPEIEPLPALPDTLPLRPPLTEPEPAPQPEEPETLPEAPPTPGRPIAPPIAPPITPPITTPRPNPSPPLPGRPPQPTLPDGRPKPEPLPPPVTRPPGTETTPDGEIGQPGTQPRPDLIGIAAELGKIEQKTLQLLNRPANPPDLADLVGKLEEILSKLEDTYPAGSYELFPVCETDAGGTPRPPMVTEWPAGTGKLDLVEAKLDAVAELIQFHKELRQPVCNRAPFGEEVTVNWIEDLTTATRATPLRKVTRYRDRTGKSVAGHVAHWEGFAWDAGPVVVSVVGPWGKVEVWAASEAEGQRVARHALQGGGWDPDSEPSTEWLAATAKSDRVGLAGRMVVAVDRQGVRITKRRGSSGPPEQVEPE
jgi:hypothetical protein